MQLFCAAGNMQIIAKQQKLHFSLECAGHESQAA
jgi:hypothetical protein